MKAYLSSAGDSERRMIMNYAGELQVTNITKKGPRKCSNRKRKNLIRLNSHVTDLLTYTEEELNRPSHDDIAESTRSRICSDEISNEGRQIIWDFAYLVFPFEQCLVLYTIAHSRSKLLDVYWPFYLPANFLLNRCYQRPLRVLSQVKSRRDSTLFGKIDWAILGSKDRG